MTTLVLTEEQARLMTAAVGLVLVRGPDGTEFGPLDPKNAALIAEAKRRFAARKPGGGVPGPKVQGHLAALAAERTRLGPAFDESTMLQFLARLRAEDRNA